MTDKLPPDYLLDAVPGAREALADWQAAAEASRPLVKAVQDTAARHAELAYVAFRRPVPDNDLDGVGQAVWEPRRGVSPSEAGEARAAWERAQMAVEAYAPVIRSKRVKFEEIIRAAVQSGDYEDMLQARSQEFQERAVAAWSALRSALADRERVARIIGTTGSLWAKRFVEDQSVDKTWSRENEEQRLVNEARARGYARSRAADAIETLDGYVREFTTARPVFGPATPLTRIEPSDITRSA